MFNLPKLLVATAISLAVVTSANATDNVEPKAVAEKTTASQDKQKPKDEAQIQCTDDIIREGEQAVADPCPPEPFDQAKTKVHAERILNAITAPAVIVKIKAVNIAYEEQR